MMGAYIVVLFISSVFIFAVAILDARYACTYRNGLVLLHETLARNSNSKELPIAVSNIIIDLTGIKLLYSPILQTKVKNLYISVIKFTTSTLLYTSKVSASKTSLVQKYTRKISFELLDWNVFILQNFDLSSRMSCIYLPRSCCLRKCYQ